MSEPASVIPVFPLPNLVLFPKLQLPLHIFEPRYRQMVRDAIARGGRIGMTLLRGDWEKDYYGNPDIYGVGCLGKIVGVTPLPDGRYNILLHGLTEYEIEEEVLGVTPYRQAKVSLRDEPPRSKIFAGTRRAPHRRAPFPSRGEVERRFPSRRPGRQAPALTRGSLALTK